MKQRSVKSVNTKYWIINKRYFMFRFNEIILTLYRTTHTHTYTKLQGSLIKIELTVRNLLQNLTRTPIHRIHKIDQETGITFPLITVLSAMKIKMLRSQRLPLGRISALHTLWLLFFLEPYGSESVRKCRKGERNGGVRARARALESKVSL